MYENYCPAIKTRQQTTWYENDSTQPIGSATLVTPTEKKKEYSTAIQEQAYQFSFDQAHRHSILLVVKPSISTNKGYHSKTRTHNNVVSIDRLKAANLSFEALNSQVAADHSTSLQENFSMPATPPLPPPPPSPEQSHPLQTRHKADSPHSGTSPLYPLPPSTHKPEGDVW